MGITLDPIDYAIAWKDKCLAADAKFVAAMRKHHPNFEVDNWVPPVIEKSEDEPEPKPEPRPEPKTIPLAVWHWSCTAIRPFDNLRVEVKAYHPQMATIQRLVAARYNVSRDELRSRSRKLEFIHPRAIAMFLCRDLIPRDKCSFPTIGRAFGYRDHTTIMNACDRITERMEADQNFHKEIVDLRQEIAEAA